MQKLYVLYDWRCGLCSRVRSWMLDQTALVELEFIPAGSPRARALFPDVRDEPEPEELIVISDEGEVYRDDAAFIICLYALKDYRAWSCRLASPALLPLARYSFDMLSKNRGLLSSILRFDSDAVIAGRLARQQSAECRIDERPQP